MPTEPWQPDVQEVAPLLRARLRASGATEFTETSTPNLEDAQGAVDDAVTTVLGLGAFPVRLHGTARSFVKHQAAATLETSTYPAQTRSDQSPRPHWQTIADARWKTLVAGASTPVDPGTGEPAVAGLPQWTHSARPSISGRPW